MTGDPDALCRYSRAIEPFGAKTRAQHGVETITLPDDKMAWNGGGIHGSTCPPIHDPAG